MLYKSTRNSKIRVTASQAIAQGISDEGGLFVPETLPDIKNKLEELSKLDYLGRAKVVLKEYLSDFSVEEINECVEKAYDAVKFENSEPIKLVKLESNNAPTYMLELWHGPTCAFKDMALQILPHLLTKALKKNYDGKTAVILVATSGDTGKAALEGFKDVPSTKIAVFYPNNGVSPMQLKQMNTQEGENVTVCAVEGNFDDCQTQVKRIFTDPEMKKLLAENDMIFSSANSINWGRLLPQIVYYVSSYLDLYTLGEIESLETPVNIVVPTGNFGNILAAYYAKQMGIPINKLICASNSNNVLTDFINCGEYNKDRNFYTTISPSMDILVSSNLERLLYHLSGDNDEVVSTWMKELTENGHYTVDSSTLNKISSLFAAGCCNDEETKAEINKKYTTYNYLCDTHTAVALKVLEDYSITDNSVPSIVASTASPYKFCKSVLNSINVESPEDEFEAVELLSRVTGTDIPSPISALQNKVVRFNNLVNKDNIADFVKNILGL